MKKELLILKMAILLFFCVLLFSGTAQAQVCIEYTTEASCPADRCYWCATMGKCYPISICATCDRLDQGTCLNSPLCHWVEAEFQCVAKSCGNGVLDAWPSGEQCDGTVGCNNATCWCQGAFYPDGSGNCRATLTVTMAGSGTGTVTSSPAGISCGLDCQEGYLAGTIVTLTAVPSTGYGFTGWSGACTGTGTCTVTMNGAKTVTATFGECYGYLVSQSEPDPLQPGVQWWRDTTNQNDLATYYCNTYPQWHTGDPSPVTEVVPGVYVVRGIGKSNVVALIGTTEWVLIDSMDSPVNMQLALLFLRPYLPTDLGNYKPPKALIYSSEDYAHYSGSSKVAPFYSIPVYASAEFIDALIAKSAYPNFVLYNMRITGKMLPEDPDWRIGPITEFGAFPFHTPNQLVSGETSLTLAGFNITLIPAVSATDAGLMVWLPDYKVLIAGDTWSPSFPDIGPLAGPSRPVQDWVNALNAMMVLNPDYMVPTHGPVISSNGEIQSILTNYRDAMQDVYDSTLDLISQGLPAEDVAVLVQLPESLASDPYLQQFIADIPSAVEGIYHQDVGWFNGEPPELASSLTTARRAEIMLELGSGIEHMLQTAMSAELIADDLQSAEKALLMAWATYQTAPDNILANTIYIQALKKNAYMQRSNQIRNYYLSVAKDVERSMPADTTPPEIVITAPVNGAYYKSSAVPAAVYTATDNYDPNPAVQVTGWSNTEGVQTMTVTATDAAGNVGSASVTYTVDNTPPTITCPANIVVPTDPGKCSAAVNYPSVMATDNCSGVTVATNPPSGSVFQKGTTTVTATATDASGNTTTCSFTVTVEDKEKPVLNLPADIVNPTDPGQCSAVVNYTVTATDNCPGVTAVSNPPSGSAFPKGTTTVIATATDTSGNTATRSFTVTVVDNQPPAITGASANPSVLWPPNHKMVDVTVNYSPTDSCGQPACQISSVICNEPISSSDYTIVDGHHVKLSADRLGSGNGRIYTITITCADASGNSSSQAVKVTVPHDQGKK